MPDWKPEIRRRLANLQLAPTREAAIIEELAQHLADCYAELLASGATEAEAARRTLAELSGNELLARELRRVERQVAPEPIVLGTNRRTNMIADLWQDLRFGARMLLKQPGFALIAIVTLALGIGANTAIFSVINGVLLKPFPYHEPDRIVLLWGGVPARGEQRTQVSATDVHDWRQQNTVFEEIATFSDWTSTLSGAGEPERVAGMQVGDGYFSVMRGAPLLGRVFTPEEQGEGKDFVIVLGYGLWQRRFGGAAEVIGKKVYLSARPYTIVGVMPEDFQPLPANLVESQAQFYRPVAEPPDEDERGSRHLRAIARLKPNVSLAQAQSEMNLITQRLAQAHPKSNTGYGVQLVTLAEDTVGGLRPALVLLLLAVLVVLLIVCANIGNLLLARATAREKEIVIRAALGAGRGRLVRQLLAESLLIAGLGGGLGLLLALWGTGLITSLGQQFIPRLSRVEIELPVLLFTLVVSALAGILFGLAPAIQFSRPNLNEALKAGGRGAGNSTAQQRLRNGLIVAEVALAVVLLVSAGLLIRSIIQLQKASPGFDAENLLTMNVWLPRAKYPDAPKWSAFYDQLSQRLRTLPGVEAVGLTSVLPISSNWDRRSFQVETRPVPRGAEPEADTYVVTPGYLQAMRISLRTGRALTAQDAGNTEPVALVSETLAHRSWPGEDPLGKRIKFPGSESRPQPWRTVVGLVRDVKQYGVDKEGTMQLYLPVAQFPNSALTLVVRTAGDPAQMLGAVRNEIRGVDPDQAVFEVATMEGLLSAAISQRRFVMWLLAVFAGLALLLAAIGIYGVMSYAVTQRTHEMGIRLALGAQPAVVLKLVIGQGMRLALLGVALGWLAAWALTRWLQTLLFEVRANDLPTFSVIALLLSLVALLACWIPARRAAQVDPMAALRVE